MYSISNLISSVFYLDRKHESVRELYERLYQLTGALKNFSEQDFSLFKTWFKRIIVKRFPQEHQSEMVTFNDEVNPQGVDNMIHHLDESLKRFIEESQEKGLQKGIQEGRKKGEKEGKLEGEKKKAKDIAKKMLLKNIAVQDIAEITGLSKEMVEKLKEDI